jgi:endonuclease III related protein
MTPRGGADFFEIAIGAILTQNIAWKNVNKALAGLKRERLMAPGPLAGVRRSKLAAIIRPTGYYNQKAKKIKNFIAWYRHYGYSFRKLQSLDAPPLRKSLLDVNGIGPETADSILLYALNVGIFVVDAYTRRIFSRLGILTGDERYEEIQNRFHRYFKGTVEEYKEYHALIVAHGKDYCTSRKPKCGECCLKRLCNKRI